MQPAYDVIIIGSGPAGGSAAYFLGEAGKRVLVLEKEPIPRGKICGGGLSVRFLREQFPFSFEPVLKTQVSAIAYAFRGRTVSMPVRRGAVGMVMRDDLDAYLLCHARAEVIQAEVCAVSELEDRVTVDTRDGRRFETAYLIGADGVNSIAARSTGLQRKRVLMAALEAEAPASVEAMRRFGHQPVFIFGDIPNGYLWIFPKSNHLSVGIAALRPAPGVLRKTLNNVMARYGISLEEVPVKGHPIPIYTRREPAATKRILLTGDAAGLADPLSGEGIRHAVKSGRLAAQAIIHDRVDRYSRDLFRSIGFNHLVTYAIAALFYRFQDFYLFFGTPNPFSTQAVIDLLSDRVTIFQFFLIGIITYPLFLLTEFSAGLARLFGNEPLAHRIRALIYPEAVQPE